MLWKFLLCMTMCVIGLEVKILGKIVVADGVVIGANSVVNNSILEKMWSVAGVPAKAIEKEKFKVIVCIFLL